MSDVLEGNPSEAMNRVLVNVMQVISIFSTFPLKWPNALLSLFSISQAVSVLGESLVNPSCELSWSAENIFYSKNIALAVAPVAIVIVSACFWRLWALLAGQSFRFGVSHDAVHRRSGVGGDLERSVELAAVAQKVVHKDIKDTSTGITSPPAPTLSSATNPHAMNARNETGQPFQSGEEVRLAIVSALKARKPTPKDKFYVSTVILLYLFYPSACKNTFQILACTEVGPDQWYLSADLQQECFRGTHLSMIIALCLPQMLLYVAGLPLVAFTVLYKNRHQLETARTKFRWGILYVGLRRDRYFWEFIVSVRKAAIFSLSVMAQSNYGLAIQTHMAMFVLIMSLVAHLVGQPYIPTWWLLDVFEVSGLVMCWLLMWSGIVFYHPSSTDRQIEVVTLALIVTSGLYTLAVAIVTIRQKAQEGAAWTTLLARSLCACISEKIKLRLFGWIPVIERAAQYSSSAKFKQEQATNRREDSMQWQGTRDQSMKWMRNPGAGSLA
jgi:hypothetical protein